MKNLFFLFAFVCYASTAAAQLTKGHWLVGGNGSFDDYTGSYNSLGVNSGATYTDISISADIGYFVTDKLAFGLKPTFSSLKDRDLYNSSGSTNFQRYWLGLFGRYYLLDKKKSYNILVDASYQFGAFVSHRITSDTKLRNFSMLVGPVIYFNSSVGIEFLMGYNHRINNFSTIESTHEGVQIVIGLQINLKK